jgi:hypothetical protein
MSRLNPRISIFFSLLLILLASSPAPCGSTHESIPAEISPDANYLFFLHGQIVEDKGVRPVSETFGTYEYQEILAAFAGRGFVVISEARSRGTDVWGYAKSVAGQVRQLLSSGVDAANITVVGASKGGAIAIAVSSMIQNDDVSYVIIAACSEKGIDLYASRGVFLSGRVLSIYDVSDTFTGSCEEYFMRSMGRGLGEYKEVVLNTGMGHGFHYSPSPEWIEPAVDWALGETSRADSQSVHSKEMDLGAVQTIED